MLCLQIFATNLKNSAIIFFENRFKNLNILVSSSLANFLRISRQRSIELDEHALANYSRLVNVKTGCTCLVLKVKKRIQRATK